MRRAADLRSGRGARTTRLDPRLQFLSAVAAFLLVAASRGFAATDNILRLAVTTTTDNTGLVNYLVRRFETDHGFLIRVMAGGTGKALRLLVNGDVDVALTHARELELPLVDDGDVIDRHEIMHNDFVIVGPATDPAGVRKVTSPGAAFRRIATARHRFISRGDDSGTHVKEQALWHAAALEPAGDWYLEAGQGMGKTLQIAGELGAYTLTDRGTWLAYGPPSGLVLVHEHPPSLDNIYSVIRANPKRHPHVNERGAITWTTWLRSGEAARLIADFRIDGQSLFTPIRVPD